MPEGGTKRILITGANRGLGLAVARALGQHGHALVVTARDQAKASDVARVLEQDCDTVDVVSRVLDLASLASVRNATDWLVERGTPIDIVLHNAGMLFPPETCTRTDADIEETLQVHAVAPLLLSEGLRPVLSRPSRTWFVGSSLHQPGSMGPEVRFSHDDPNLQQDYDPKVAYKNTKLAALWVAYEWERRFGGQGHHADVLSPGFVPTTAASAAPSWLQRFGLKHVLPRMPFATSLEDATAGIVKLLLQTPQDEPGGRYFQHGKPTDSSPQSRDADQAARFWTWASARTALGER